MGKSTPARLADLIQLGTSESWVSSSSGFMPEISQEVKGPQVVDRFCKRARSKRNRKFLARFRYFTRTKSMPPPAHSIRLKLKRLSRLFVEQLKRKLSFHPGAQKRRGQKNIYEAVHDSRCTPGLIRKTLHRAERMVQTRSRLKRHAGPGTQANELDDTLARWKLVGGLTARPNLGSPPATRHRSNELHAIKRREFEIGHEFGWNDSRQPRDLRRICNLHLNRLNDCRSARTVPRHLSIEFANASDLRIRIGAEKRRQPPTRERLTSFCYGQFGECRFKLTKPRHGDNETSKHPVPFRPRIRVIVGHARPHSQRCRRKQSRVVDQIAQQHRSGVCRVRGSSHPLRSLQIHRARCDYLNFFRNPCQTSKY